MQKLALQNDELCKSIYKCGEDIQKQQRKYDQLHEVRLQCYDRLLRLL